MMEKLVRILRTVLGVVYVPAMMCFFAWLYAVVFGLDLPKTAWLKAETARWESKIDVLDHSLRQYDLVLTDMEERNNGVYRSIFGLNEIPAETQSAVLKREARHAYLDEMGANPGFKRSVMEVDRLSSRAVVQSRALDEVGAVSRHADEMISCVPAVPPILPKKGSYRYTSPFGYRSDPVHGHTAFHRGHDLATAKGTPVYATGDGVVELASFQFRGYGNEIIINHGFGYKTLYAHLNTIEVQVGMKVSRGERIGTVGNTGKSTAPHLHYEVHYMGHPVNPYSYYDMDMPVEEYKAMITKAADISPRGKISSQSELLKRRSTADD